MKQCPNCKGNLADYVPLCPYCGVNVAVPPGGPVQPAWTGPQENSGKATASLVCGILTFLCVWPASVAAVILGHIALADIKKSGGRLTGRGMAVAGLVLGYIGVFLLPLVIAAIAIPNLLRARMAANEASAVGTLRTYNTAMIAYTNACPDVGYPASLESLGPGSKDCGHADLVQGPLAVQVPVKDGYHFFYSPQKRPGGLINRYVLAADPVNPGTSGIRHFFTDESGVIRTSTRSGADANSEPLQ